jgi:hypothetical protein
MHIESSSLCIACQESGRHEPSLLCRRCFGRMRGDLDAIAWAYGWIGEQMQALRPSWRTGTIHRQGEPQPPMDVRLVDHRVHILGVLASWARMIGEEHQPAIPGPADPSLTTVVEWVHGLLPWCSDQPWCDDLARELGELRRTAQGLVPWERSRHDLPVPCRRCGKLSLSLYGGSDAVVCRELDCAERFTWAAYEKIVRTWHAETTANLGVAA